MSLNSSYVHPCPCHPRVSSQRLEGEVGRVRECRRQGVSPSIPPVPVGTDVDRTSEGSLLKTGNTLTPLYMRGSRRDETRRLLTVRVNVSAVGLVPVRGRRRSVSPSTTDRRSVLPPSSLWTHKRFRFSSFLTLESQEVARALYHKDIRLTFILNLINPS